MGIGARDPDYSLIGVHYQSRLLDLPSQTLLRFSHSCNTVITES